MVAKSTMIPNKAPHPNKRRAPEHAKASLTRNDETPTAQAAKKSTLTSMMEARGDTDKIVQESYNNLYKHPKLISQLGVVGNPGNLPPDQVNF
jgi:hypothetical protein